MSGFFKGILKAGSRFLAVKSRRRLLFLVVLGIIALSEFIVLGLARRTFVFYTVDKGIIVVEDRMVKRSPSREVNITRYVEEMLLGPAAPDLLPLFPRETRLRALLYRNGVIYADFSIEAAFPPEEGGETLDNFRTMHAGILRNFSFVRDVRFFIVGNAVYVEEFRQPDSEASGGSIPVNL